MTVEMQKERRMQVPKEVWFSVSAVLPLFGKPSLLFLLGVGAAGPKASCQQERIHLEGNAGHGACEWIFTLCVPHFVQWPAFSMWGQVCTYFVFQLSTWGFFCFLVFFGCFGQTVFFPRTAQTLKSGVHFPPNPCCFPSALRVLLQFSSPFISQDLIDRLVAVDSEAKINSLFHYEQSHTFGLRWDAFSLFYYLQQQESKWWNGIST